MLIYGSLPLQVCAHGLNSLGCHTVKAPGSSRSLYPSRIAVLCPRDILFTMPYGFPASHNPNPMTYLHDPNPVSLLSTIDFSTDDRDRISHPIDDQD
jgi:hypothetical protein